MAHRIETGEYPFPYKDSILSITVSPPGRAILEDEPKREIRRTIHAMLFTSPKATLKYLTLLDFMDREAGSVRFNFLAITA